MDILLITFDFPPSSNAHAYRWFGAIQEWLRMGHSVQVIAGLDCTDPNAQVIDHPNFRMVRVGSSRLTALRARHQPASLAAGASSKPLKTRAVDLLRRVYRFLYWPDGVWHWYPYVRSAAARLHRPAYDLVITYAPSFVAHLVGLDMKRSGRAKVWLADYGDPFTPSVDMPHNNLRLFRNLNYRAERKVLEIANAVSFTNQQTLKIYREAFQKGRLLLIPHAVSFDEIDLAMEQEKNASKDGKCQLTYLGAFHKGIREGRPTFENLLQALDFEPSLFSIKVVGSLNGVMLPNHPALEIKPPVPRHAALQELAAADILIHIENLSVPMSPSKVVDYIASGKPVLNFHTGQISALFQRWPYALNLHVANDNSRAILNFVKLHRHRRASPETAREHLKDYDVKVTAQLVADLARTRD